MQTVPLLQGWVTCTSTPGGTCGLVEAGCMAGVCSLVAVVTAEESERMGAVVGGAVVMGRAGNGLWERSSKTSRFLTTVPPSR